MSRFFSFAKLPKSMAKQSSAPKNPRGYRYALREFAYNWSGYNKFGLYTHDLLCDDNTIVREALRRLPKDVLDTRGFRLIRAAQLDFLRIYLPKEKWLTFEEDLEYRYMDPYLAEVLAERTEIYEFGCVNYKTNDWPAFELK